MFRNFWSLFCKDGLYFTFLAFLRGLGSSSCQRKNLRNIATNSLAQIHGRLCVSERKPAAFYQNSGQILRRNSPFKFHKAKHFWVLKCSVFDYTKLNHISCLIWETTIKILSFYWKFSCFSPQSAEQLTAPCIGVQSDFCCFIGWLVST